MNYKLLLPFDDYILSTALTNIEVRNNLANTIEPTSKSIIVSINNKRTKPYEGKLTSSGFTMSRVINYRNSFLPQISGQILTSAGGTKVHIRMRPHLFGLIFMSFWLGVVGLVCAGLLTEVIAHFGKVRQEGFSPFLLIPFGMFAIGYGMLIGGYRIESKKSKAFLSELLNGQEWA